MTYCSPYLNNFNRSVKGYVFRGQGQNAFFQSNVVQLDTLYIASQMIYSGYWENHPPVEIPDGTVTTPQQVTSRMKDSYNASLKTYLQAITPLVCAKKILTGDTKKDAAAPYTKLSTATHTLPVNGVQTEFVLVQMADKDGNLRSQDLEKTLFQDYAEVVTPADFFVDPDNVWKIPETPNWKTSYA